MAKQIGFVDLLKPQDRNVLLINQEFTGAILGVCVVPGQATVVAYDYDRCVKVIMKQGKSKKQAIEHMELKVIKVTEDMKEKNPSGKFPVFVKKMKIQ